MKMGRLEKQEDDIREAGEKVFLEEPAKREEEFEKDGIHYHIENMEQKFKGLFNGEIPDEVKRERKAVLEQLADDDISSEELEERITFQAGKRTEEKLQAYLKELDESTPEHLKESSRNFDPEYTSEELEQIWENDPGYLNELAVKKLPRAKKSVEEAEYDQDVVAHHSKYMEFGFHNKNLENYGADAVEGTVDENYVLAPGKIVERWGQEDGSYLTEPGTYFEDLHLNVSEGKLICTQYEVLKALPVVKSEIADQPFDEERKDGNKRQPALQYKSAIYIDDLVELGVLRRVAKEER